MDKATYKLPKKYSKYLMSTYITAVWPEIVDFNKITYLRKLNHFKNPDIVSTIKEELKIAFEQYVPKHIYRLLKNKKFDIDVSVKLINIKNK